MPGPVALVVLVQAAVSSAIAMAAAQVAGCGRRQGREPGRTVCADMGCSFCAGDRSGSAWPGPADPGLGGDLDSVPGAAQRRGVGQGQVADGVDGHTVVNRGGGDVGALGDLGVLVAEQLHAEEPAGGAVAGDADGHAVAAGVVGLVVIGGRFDGDRVESGGGGFVVAQAGAGGGLVEDLDDLGAEAAGELPVAAEGVLPGDPALLVGGGAERQVRLAEEPVVGDHAVPGGEDVR